METIENNQANIKEIVDGDSVSLEHKIYRTMDLRQDMDDLQKLLKDCEDDKAKASELADQIKKAKIGLMNLKAYLGQVDCIEFATAIRFEVNRTFKNRQNVLNLCGITWLYLDLNMSCKLIFTIRFFSF